LTSAPGIPNPALTDTLDTKITILGSFLKSDGSRKRALVPGCGKGYDVYLFAAYGYDAYGLEVGHAVEAARVFASEAETKEEYRCRDAKAGKGKVEFVQGDFYAKEWEQGIGEGGFDIIYDYTVGPFFHF
jgi:SAM-dependent methyltransferase